MDQRDASTAAALYRLASQSSLAQGFAGGALVFGQPAVMFCEAVVLITTLLTRAAGCRPFSSSRAGRCGYQCGACGDRLRRAVDGRQHGGRVVTLAAGPVLLATFRGPGSRVAVALVGLAYGGRQLG